MDATSNFHLPLRPPCVRDVGKWLQNNRKARMDKERVTEISEDIKLKSKVHRACFLNKDRAVKKRNV
jgi:hypothetical protein